MPEYAEIVENIKEIRARIAESDSTRAAVEMEQDAQNKKPKQQPPTPRKRTSAKKANSGCSDLGEENSNSEAEGTSDGGDDDEAAAKKPRSTKTNRAKHSQQSLTYFKKWDKFYRFFQEIADSCVIFQCWTLFQAKNIRNFQARHHIQPELVMNGTGELTHSMIKKMLLFCKYNAVHVHPLRHYQIQEHYLDRN